MTDNKVRCKHCGKRFTRMGLINHYAAVRRKSQERTMLLQKIIENNELYKKQQLTTNEKNILH